MVDTYIMNNAHCTNCSNNTRHAIYNHPVTGWVCMDSAKCADRIERERVAFGIEYRTMLIKRHGLAAVHMIMTAQYNANQ